MHSCTSDVTFCVYETSLPWQSHESWHVPAGVFSALADILEAEVGPIIDIVTERGGA